MGVEIRKNRSQKAHGLTKTGKSLTNCCPELKGLNLGKLIYCKLQKYLVPDMGSGKQNQEKKQTFIHFRKTHFYPFPRLTFNPGVYLFGCGLIYRLQSLWGNTCSGLSLSTACSPSGRWGCLVHHGAPPPTLAFPSPLSGVFCPFLNAFSQKHHHLH